MYINRSILKKSRRTGIGLLQCNLSTIVGIVYPFNAIVITLTWNSKTTFVLVFAFVQTGRLWRRMGWTTLLRKATRTTTPLRIPQWPTTSPQSPSDSPIPWSKVTEFKGTQDWEFFWLRFWNLRYFFVSYGKILRFYKKNFLKGPLLGELRFFRVVLGLRGMKKNFELGQKFFFFFLQLWTVKITQYSFFENSIN